MKYECLYIHHRFPHGTRICSVWAMYNGPRMGHARVTHGPCTGSYGHRTVPQEWSYDCSEPLKALVPTRRTCKCVLSTCKNVGKIWGSVRGEYRLSTDLGARRHSVALLVHEELSLRSGCGRATDSPPVRVTRVPSTANERTTH